MDLDQLGTTTKPVKMVADAYVPGLSRNLLSTCKAVKQCGKPLIYYKTKAVSGFPGEESLVFNFCSRKTLFYAICVRRIPGEGAALARKTTEAMRIKTPGQWGACRCETSPNQRVALALASKTAEAMRRNTTVW